MHIDGGWWGNTALVVEPHNMMGPRYTRDQYVGVLGQEYHLAVNVPFNLRLAAARVTEEALAAWLRSRAKEEEVYPEWLLADLAALQAPPTAPNAATLRLLACVREVVAGPEPHGVLGVLCVQEQVWREPGRAALVPEDCWHAARYFGRWQQPSASGLLSLEEALNMLAAPRQREVWRQADEFAPLYQEFAAQAALRPTRAAA